MFDNDINDSIEWLKKYEGFKSKPYWDVNRMSIGYGTPANGLNNISEHEATNSMINEIQNRRAELGKDYPLGISPWAKKALDDRLYNAGVGAVRGSKFLANLKNLDEDSAANELLNWNKKRVGGKLVEDEGLTNRVRDLYNSRMPASETQTYDSSKSPFFQQPYVKEQLESLKPSNEPYKSFLQQQEDSKKYVDDGFRMMGVEGGKAPESYVNLNRLFSNDVPVLDVLPKTSFSPIQPIEGILPVTQQVEEIQPEVIDEKIGEQKSPDITGDNDDLRKSKVETNIASEPVKEKSLHPLIELMNKYADIQNRSDEIANKDTFWANLLKAGQTIGGAIAGVRPDYSFADSMIEQGKRGPASVKEQLKNQLGVYKSIQDEKSQNSELDLKKRYYGILEKQLEQAKLKEEQNKLEKIESDKLKRSDLAEKRFDTFMKQYNEDIASSRTDLGMNAKNIRVAQDIKALIEGRADPEQFSNVELKEMAMGMNSLFSPTGVPSMRVTESLTPKTFMTEFAKWKQFASSSPAAAKAGGFANLYGHIVDRQMEINLAQLKQKMASAFAPYSKVEGIRSLPQTEAWMKTKGLTDEDVEKALKGEYTKENLTKSLSKSGGMKKVQVEGKIYNMSPESIEKAKKDGHQVIEVE